MRRIALGPPPAAPTVGALVVAGCGGGSNRGGGSSCGPTHTSRLVRAETVSTGPTPVGTVLVGGRGRTLDLFEMNKGHGQRLRWSVRQRLAAATTSDKGTVTKGLSPAELGAIKRSEGKAGLTYAGHPLYPSPGDKQRRHVNAPPVVSPAQTPPRQARSLR